MDEDAERRSTESDDVGNMSSQLERSSSMFSQLEVMMSAVRQESAALENMKAKLKEFEQLKLQIPALEGQLADMKKENLDAVNAKTDQDKVVAQLRLDMQRLNDLYNTERKQHLDSKHVQLRQEQELITANKTINQLQSTAHETSILEKRNKDLHREVTVLQARLDEEKSTVARSLQMLEKQNEDTEKIKAELSQHFWNLSEELKGNKQRLEESEMIRNRLESSMGGINEAFNQSLESAGMATADRQSLEIEVTWRHAAKESKHVAEREALRSSVQELKLHVAELEAAKGDMERHAELLRKDSSHLMSSHANQIQALSDKNKELLASEVRLCHKIEAMERANQNIEKLRVQEKMENDRLEGLVADLQRDVKSVSAERDKAILASESTTTHTTALEEQLKDAHAKQWADIQSLKEKELQFEVEVKGLQDTLQERDSRIGEMEAEKESIEKMYQGEIAQVSQMSGVLKAELEKRLDELTSCVKERDGLRAENSRMEGTVETMTADMKKREKIFQHALDTDRAKIQQELKAKHNRIRNLEAEKQELLSETSQLMNQLQVEQKSKSHSERNFSEINRSLTSAQEEIKNLRLENVRLGREVEEGNKRERELQDKLSDVESQFKIDISRLDSIVKESRKTAAQQVGELMSKCQSLTDELADDRKHKADLEKSERQAVQRAEEYSTELKALRSEFEDFQMTAGKEIANAKREAQNMHGKVKTLADIKAKMEMELVSLRMERARAGSDVTQLADKIKALEDKCSSLENDLTNTTEELQKMTASSRRNKASAVDLEANLQRHVKMLSKATEEIERLEKHSFMEGKKLRTNLNNANRKLHENSETIAKLTLEVESASTNFAKLQTSTNDTINGLMEELKRTEDALSKERTSNSQELGKAHQKVSALQSQLENMKDSLNEKLIQTESDRSDKQVMLLQLNSEVHRLKQLNDGKDARIDELEKQHQEDRLKLQELRSKITRLESELSEVRIELAKTDKLKRALDVKFQKQVSSPSRQYEDTWSGHNGGDYGASADAGHDQNDFDSKNRMYLQDDEEYEGVKSKYSGGVYGIGDDDDGGDDAAAAYGSTYDPYGSLDDDGEEYHGHYSTAAVATIDASPINSSRGGGGDKDDEYVDEDAFQRAIAAAGTNMPTYGRMASAKDMYEASSNALYGHDGKSQVGAQGGSSSSGREGPMENSYDDDVDTDPSSVAASIARTQRFLQRRGKGVSKSSDSIPSTSAAGALASRNDADRRGRGQPKSRSGSRQGGGVGRGSRGGADVGRQVAGATYLHDDNGSNDDNDFAFDAPLLMPATPPVLNGGGGLSYAGPGADDDDVPMSRESSRSVPVHGSEGFAKDGSTSSRSELRSRSKSSSSKKNGKVSTRGASSSGGSGSRRGGGDEDVNILDNGDGVFPRISPLRKGSGRKGSA